MAHPVIAGTAETAVVTAGTSHTVTLPGGGSATDLYLIVMDIGSTLASLNALAGWVEVLDEAVANGLKVLRYSGAGVPSNPTFVSTAATRSASIAYRITGADKAFVSPQVGTTATGTSATPDPPASAAISISKDYLFVAFAGMAGEEADDDTWANTPPTNYTPSPPLQVACGTVGTNLGGLICAASRQLTTGSAEDPGTFNVDVSAAWRAQTVTVHPEALFDQDSFRFRNDDGDEATASWRQAVNTPDTVPLDTNIRLRFALEETNTGDPGSQSYVLEFRVKPAAGSFGAWASVQASATDQVRMALSPNFTDSTATTRQIWASATGFVAGQIRETASAMTKDLAPLNTTEAEFCILLDSTTATPAANGDTYEFRITAGTSGTFTYTNTPSLVAGVAGTDWTQPVDDTLSLADALAFDRGLTIADTVALSDGTSSAATFDRVVTDSVTPADALSFDRDVHVADSVTPIADSATTQAGKEAALSDTVTPLTDALVFDRGLGVTDTVTMSDATAFDRAITIADSVTPSDLATTARGIAQAVTDTVTPIADLAATQSGKEVQLTDIVTMSDAALVFDRGLTITDTVTPSDALAFSRDLHIADTAALTDVVAFAEEIHVADTLSLADQATTSAGDFRTIDDTVTMSDQVAFDRDIHPAADTVTMSDARTFDRGLASADSVTMSDAAPTFARGYGRQVDDTLTMSDALSFARDLHIADTVDLADAAVPVKSGAGTQSVSDSVTLSDAISFVATYDRTVADTVTMSDLATTSRGLSVQIGDTLSLSDSTASASATARTISDSVTMSDALSFAAGVARTISDTVTMSDLVATERGRTQAISDTLSLTDAFRFDRGLGIVDTVAVADALQFLATYERLLADTVTIDDLCVPLWVSGITDPGTGYIDFPNIGLITKPVGGIADEGAGIIDTAVVGRLAHTGKGALP